MVHTDAHINMCPRCRLSHWSHELIGDIEDEQIVATCLECGYQEQYSADQRPKKNN